MSWKIMERKAADNEYLHRDFHAALSCALDFVAEKFGAEAVVEYLKKFTNTWHAPLKEQIKREGISALKKHYQDLYGIEKVEVQFEENTEQLIMRTPFCPAVKHMRASNRKVSEHWIETERSVNATLVEETDFEYELSEYDATTGKSVQIFRKVRT